MADDASNLTDAPDAPRRLHALAGAAVVILTLAALYPLAEHGFVEWDDPHNLFANPRLNPPTLRGLAHYWVEPEGGLYVPLVYTAWYPLALLARQTGTPGELDPRVFHVANLVVHAGCALAVYALLHALLRVATRVGAGRAVAGAAIGAALFALHPVQVESVAWASGLKDLLGGLFSAVALWLYVRAIDPRPPAPAARRRRLYALATVSFGCALLSKPVAVTVPLVALLLDVGLVRRDAWRAIGMLIPWAILSVPVLVVTRNAQPIPVVYAITPWRVRPAVAGDALAFYLRQVVLPARLALDYGRSPDVIAARKLALLAWVGPILVAVVLWLVRRRVPFVSVGGAVFLVALLPVLGFRPFGAQVYSTVTDHYLYLPMLGVALAAAWAASRASPGAACAVALPVLVALGVRSWFQTAHWRDTRALFTHNLRVNPRSWTSHINLAADALLRHDFARAERHAREAIVLRPGDGLIYTDLGVALLMQGRADEAVAPLETAARLAPDDPATRVWLGEALYRLGRVAEARQRYAEALRLDPRNADARAGLARTRASSQPASRPASRPASATTSAPSPP